MIFRFDDVSINSPIDIESEMTEELYDRFKGNVEIIWAVSPMVCQSEKFEGRVYPKIWNAMSDFREFYEVDDLGIPDLSGLAKIASHGLIHVDHRLLHYSAQEMSILISCSLLNSNIFVPPFNKWNKDTESICNENGIKLIKWEEGWLSMEHNDFNKKQNKWYLHGRFWHLKKMREWFDKS